MSTIRAQASSLKSRLSIRPDALRSARANYPQKHADILYLAHAAVEKRRTNLEADGKMSQRELQNFHAVDYFADRQEGPLTDRIFNPFGTG